MKTVSTKLDNKLHEQFMTICNEDGKCQSEMLRDLIEIALLRSEIDILKGALRNKIARHEISLIKKGKQIESIID